MSATAMTVATPQHATTGEFIRTPEQIARDLQAADLRSLGYTYAMIGERMGVDRSTACRMVQRSVMELPTEGAEEVRRVELEKIDRAERYYNGILSSPPPKIGNNGKVVHDDQGRVVIDEGIRMDAATGILKAQAARAKLLGLNAPTRIQEEVVVYDADPDREQRIREMVRAAVDAKHDS